MDKQSVGIIGGCLSQNGGLCWQNCGVPSEELGKVLRLLALKKKRLLRLLPLLEFITWSLLKEESTVIL